MRHGARSNSTVSRLGSLRPCLVPTCHLMSQLRDFKSNFAMLDSSRRMEAFTVRPCGMCATVHALCSGSLWVSEITFQSPDFVQ